MLCFVALFASLLSLTNARVTFPKSEVLQAQDIAGTNRATFACKNICKLYADRKYNNLVITQNGNLIANFNTIVSGNAAAPTGVVLPAGDNYVLENRGEVNPQFVLFIVDSTAQNYGSLVVAPQQAQGVAIKDNARYVTVLSSFDAVEFSGFTGAFPPGYPRIYAAGFDAATDAQCRPVYQARSQRAAEKSWPVVPTAVLTIDFGFMGAHTVSVNQVKASDRPMAAGLSVVYTSPGYVGCSAAAGQNYYSNVNRLAEAFTLLGDSLDIDGLYNNIAPGEPIQLNVNNDKVALTGSSAYTKHYVDKSFSVALSWVRQTPAANFAFQLDFGTSSDPNVPETTTKIGRSLSVLTSLAFVIMARATRMFKLVFIFGVSISVVVSRVTFAKSEVLDDVDLKGTTTASFRCSVGCRVYSPTRNEKVVIVDSAGKEYKSLLNLADLKLGEFVELTGGKYQLKNKGAADPSFVFYAVEKGAPSYETTVAYVSSTSKITLASTTDTQKTVMSSSGAIRFSHFTGDFQTAFPSVYATGFDSVADTTCRAVYETVSAISILNTAFPLYSPIATINFKKTGAGRSVVVSGEQYISTTTGLDATAVFVSPGYVGCGIVGDSMYTSALLDLSFDSTIRASHSSGLFVILDGDFSIANAADAATLTVNDEVQKLYGKDQKLARTVDGMSASIGVEWARREGGKDRFALQIDVMADDGLAVQTTTNTVPTMTTSGVNQLDIGSALMLIVIASLY
ncbi:hypothetical protein PRIPAC_80136 [Pristionchus pacificus]|uniref:Uncharacterized protein n=1 Tax=Pristionchus pacificus TaxID=54126 RepID=A0A2A6BI97_PRIPA|nr:hypothetical protein PRIPAC_80136 [Pristionchus pacificus]|eukprot:PDM65556.1 hypothetical protein PRIPAC_52498 [Pristionchus pacificus]